MHHRSRFAGDRRASPHSGRDGYPQGGSQVAFTKIMEMDNVHFHWAPEDSFHSLVSGGSASGQWL